MEPLESRHLLTVATLALDGGMEDLQPAPDLVTITSEMHSLEIQLTDAVGIDDSTVGVSGVTISKNSTPLAETVDYGFQYDPGTDLMTLTSLGGDFSVGTYEIGISGVKNTGGTLMSPAALNLEIGIATLKNVIVLIGDGMGPEHVKAGHVYAGGDLVFETFPYQGELTTYAAGGGIPDSAAAATAIATGQKVNTSVISVALPGDGSELPTSLEYYPVSYTHLTLPTILLV